MRDLAARVDEMPQDGNQDKQRRQRQNVFQRRLSPSHRAFHAAIIAKIADSVRLVSLNLPLGMRLDGLEYDILYFSLWIAEMNGFGTLRIADGIDSSAWVD